MKNTKKRIILGLAAIMTLSNSQIYSYAMEEEPIENQGQEIVEDVPYDTGWIQGTDGKYYYIDESGSTVTGWKEIEGKEYYFDETGAWIEETQVEEVTEEQPVQEQEYLNVNQWIKDNNGWWYRHEDGSYITKDFEVIDGKTYYFNASGYMVTGWNYIENNWYYFDGSGAMKTDWILLGKTWYYMEPDGKMVTGRQTIREKEYYFDTSGAMKTGWIKLEGKDYYYNPDGALMKDTWIGDYYVDETGAWIPNKFKPKWIKDNTGWWYRHEDGGYTKNDFEKIGNATYYFDKNGYMVTNWKQVEDNWYYFDGSGAMKTDWLLLGNTWYYLGSDGKMVTGRQTIREKEYYFDASGAMKTGWIQIEDQYYYFDKSGAMVKNQWIDGYWLDENGVWIVDKYQKDEWILTSKGWRYRHTDGSYTKSNFEVIGNATYYFDEEGYMETGWIQIESGTYYANRSGAILTGWQKIGETRYYFEPMTEPIGQKVYDTRKTIEGADYFFDKEGKMVVGWCGREEGKYYTNKDGHILTGWLKENGKWYYLDPNNTEYPGLMVHDEIRVIDGNEYTFTSDGSILTGFVDKESGKYLINEDGYMVKGWGKYQGYWYYCLPEGSENPGLLLQNQWLDLDNSWYFLAEDGKMKTGWFLLEGSWYYAPDNGAILQNGFGIIAAKDAGGQEKLAYFEASGSLRMHSFDIGKKNYIVNGSGYIVQTVLHGITYYSQRDPRWANVWIGGYGSFSGTGCLPSVATSLVNYYLGTWYIPTDLGNLLHANGYYNVTCYGASSDSWRFIANNYGFSFSNNLSYDDMRMELLKGNIVVGAVGSGTFVNPGFTHELLLYGLDENGYCNVYDPLDSNKNGKYHLSTIYNQRSFDGIDTLDGGPFYSLGH